MLLNRWLQDHRLTVAKFADWVGTDRSTVHRWNTGERMPTAEMLDLVRSKTNDQVTPTDFHNQWRRHRRLRSDEIVETRQIALHE